MFSGKAKTLRTTAAWRLSVGMTLAFAIGSALAFGIIYQMVADSIRQRTDAWLSGEAEVLASVAINAPQDSLYSRIVEEVAELATREVGQEDSQGHPSNSVFFLQVAEGKQPLWVGPAAREDFLSAISHAHFEPSVPQSIEIAGTTTAFRVVKNQSENNVAIYLGLSDQVSMRLLHELTTGFVVLWIGMVVLGFLIAFTSAFRMLKRVETITETAARIGADDFKSRLPESKHFDEISRLSRTFNHMLDRIESSVNQLRTVTDAVAHDLKSPVTWIRGRLEVALSDGQDSSWRDSVAESIEGLDRLSQFLNTTLDLAEAAGGALHLERATIDFSALVSQLVDLYYPALAERQHEVIIDLEQGIQISGDVHLMNRIVGNLLDNELMHLPLGRRIVIRLSSFESKAQLQISDNGPGFPPELRSRVLERFVKGKDSTGHGLGLSLVDAVVRAHGGKVSIENSPQGSALIVLILPLAKSVSTVGT